MDILTDLRSQIITTGQNDYLKQIKDGPANIQCTCPFHANGQERRPSFGVSKDTGIGHCFTCNIVVDLPELISYCLGHDDRGAYGWSWLRRKYITIDLENVPNIQFETEKKEDVPEYVSEEELDRYRYTHPYWAKRGITDDNILELFDLGFDRETNCITFPVRDIYGHTLFVARRSVNTKFFQYPSGVKKPLYGLYELAQIIKSNPIVYESKTFEYEDIYGKKFSIYGYEAEPLFAEIIVCESMIDCILLWQSGYYAVALNGLGNQLQMKQLNELPCKTLILATDNDKAGLEARQRIKKLVHGKLIKEVHFPDDVKDIGECTDDEIKHIEDWVSYGPKKILREY